MGTLLPPDHPLAPKFWMAETSGKLAPAIMRYLENHPEHAEDTADIRDYLRQWIISPVWDVWYGREAAALARLRHKINGIQKRGDITNWLDDALDLGIDPL